MTTLTATPHVPAAKASATVWTGRVLSGIGVLFLLVDATFKLFVSPEAVASTEALGWKGELLPTIAVIQFVCLALYLVPRTAVLGAILWTGYLGGAVATHVRVDNPLFSHMLFPVYVALLLWIGLALRDARLRALVPLRAPVK